MQEESQILVGHRCSKAEDIKKKKKPANTVPQWIIPVNAGNPLILEISNITNKKHSISPPHLLCVCVCIKRENYLLLLFTEQYSWNAMQVIILTDKSP